MIVSLSWLELEFSFRGGGGGSYQAQTSKIRDIFDIELGHSIKNVGIRERDKGISATVFSTESGLRPLPRLVGMISIVFPYFSP